MFQYVCKMNNPRINAKIFCNDTSEMLIRQHLALIANAPLDENVMNSIQFPIEMSLQEFAPLGSDQYKDLYGCACKRNLKELIRWYNQIERYAGYE